MYSNNTSKGERTQFAGCLMKGGSQEELVENIEEVLALLVELMTSAIVIKNSSHHAPVCNSCLERSISWLPSKAIQAALICDKT